MPDDQAAANEANREPDLEDDVFDEDREDSDDDVLDAVQEHLPVRIRLPGETEPRNYTIREMEPDDLDRWMKIVAKRMPTDRRGNLRGKPNFKEMHADLIALCLYDDRDQRVPLSVIRTWGTAVKAKLFVKCRSHNALDDEAEDREGK